MKGIKKTDRDVYLDHVMIGVGNNNLFVPPDSEPMRRIQICWTVAKLSESDTNVHSITTGNRRGRAQEGSHPHSTDVSDRHFVRSIWKIKAHNRIPQLKQKSRGKVVWQYSSIGDYLIFAILPSKSRLIKLRNIKKYQFRITMINLVIKSHILPRLNGFWGNQFKKPNLRKKNQPW